MAGLPQQFGSKAFAGHVPSHDDGVATRLREAGTLLVGKTTTPEFGLAPYTESDVAPPARSPWDPRRSAGGSSGGAAAAVAAGVVPVAHGNDGGGSIRIPASACGLVGLKPSRGRVSPGPHYVDGAGLTANGSLTRTVRDTAALLDVLSVGWPGDQYALPGPAQGSFLAACERPPRPLRVGVLRDPITLAEAPVHSSSHAAVDRAERVLGDLGHELQTATVPFSPRDWEAFRPLWAVGSLGIPVSERREELLLPLTRWMRAQGREFSGQDYAQAHAGIQRLARRAAAQWQEFDVILTPTLAQPSPFIGAMRDDADPAADMRAQMAFTPWTSTWNIIGFPAISVPLHRERIEGVELPIGVQLGATRLGDDALLLALAAQLEQADPWPGLAPSR